jgi:bifunctional non-homologous end joining protein LigD
VTIALPKVSPLVLKWRPAAFDNPDWLFELKYDGFRALLEIDGTIARLVSRNRNRFKHIDTLAAALAKRLRVKEVILDGEVVCADESGRPIFLEMLSGRHPVCFVAFDLLWLNGNDLRPLPLVERKARLKRLLRRRSNHLIAEAMAVDARGKALMAAVEEHDLVGIVAKRKSDPYRRGVHWWKIKNRAYSQAEGRHELFNGEKRHHRLKRDFARHSRGSLSTAVDLAGDGM